MPGLLEGKRALVTGASKGIGRAICHALAAEGAHVTGVARASNELGSLSAELGQAFDPWPYDVTGEEVLTRIAAAPAFDILINNAGTNRPEPFTQATDAALDLMLDLNVRAPFRIARAAARKMVRGATIIHMTSQMGRVGSPNRTVYCMTKHALEGLSKAMAVELAPAGIRVNCVAPTFVKTPMTETMFADPAFAAFVERMIPMGELATAEQVAAAVVYLASPAAAMITGHSLLIDGGWTAQ
ncbi:3-oxoacyl-ACP reductase [Porphyrobacter sp. TH134]|uniref:SDR family NAD(P)-dependent oxidoreductase n=1 Tax=Porphyrobacter sp. TH134 TaxID=2067450 RepID=UPI000C7A8451|nr:SDR family oxidoreductase [Porphyrobacter sp. TH134]PLK22467.1 3-oxoacyl-ACP reductase [Porphyrobacter sp. TH134]